MPGFIPKARAEDLSAWLKNEEGCGRLIQDPRANLGLFGNAYQDALPFLELLCEKLPEVSSVVGETLLPTYTYSIIYKHSSVLLPHKDRAACEISLTVHLSGDHEWPIWVKKPSGEAVNLVLAPGDAVLYLGCIAEHWREQYTGRDYSQVFMHYVRSKGPHAWAYFDKRM